MDAKTKDEKLTKTDFYLNWLLTHFKLVGSQG